MGKYYYAGHSYMGVNFTYDSPCWWVHVFDTKKKRDEYVEKNRYNDQGSIVMEPITAEIARKIIGSSAYNSFVNGEWWRLKELNTNINLECV